MRVFLFSQLAESLLSHSLSSEGRKLRNLEEKLEELDPREQVRNAIFA